MKGFRKYHIKRTVSVWAEMFIYKNKVRYFLKDNEIQIISFNDSKKSEILKNNEYIEISECKAKKLIN